MKTLLAIAALSFSTMVLPSSTAFAQTAPADPLETSSVTIDSANGSHQFDIEIADESDEISYGLMNRESLAPDAGMLFDFGNPREPAMYMKNTLIPLDMLFFDDEGRLVSAVEEATPGSLVSRRSEGPARYVLELNGGSMQAHGIRPGARLRFPLGD